MNGRCWEFYGYMDRRWDGEADTFAPVYPSSSRP